MQSYFQSLKGFIWLCFWALLILMLAHSQLYATTGNKDFATGTGSLVIISSSSIDDALMQFTDNPEKAELTLKLENSALALCYRAYLREAGMVLAAGPDDSAEALLKLAQGKLPPDLYALATEKTEWSDASETLNRILTTLFVLQVNSVNTQ